MNLAAVAPKRKWLWANIDALSKCETLNIIALNHQAYVEAQVRHPKTLNPQWDHATPSCSALQLKVCFQELLLKKMAHNNKEGQFPN